MYVRKTKNQVFEPMDVAGIELNRLYMNDDEAGGGATIVRMKKGAKYPLHSHPGTEQAVVLSGSAQIANQVLREGDFWHTSPGEVHSVRAIDDLVFFVVTEASIRLLEDQ